MPFLIIPDIAKVQKIILCSIQVSFKHKGILYRNTFLNLFLLKLIHFINYIRFFKMLLINQL